MVFYIGMERNYNMIIKDLIVTERLGSAKYLSRSRKRSSLQYFLLRKLSRIKFNFAEKLSILLASVNTTGGNLFQNGKGTIYK